jgi:hypothetical protein
MRFAAIELASGRRIGLAEPPRPRSDLPDKGIVDAPSDA